MLKNEYLGIMPLYRWKGKNLKGEEIKGEIEAPSKEEAESRLREQGILPSKIVKIYEIHIPFLTGKVSLKDIVIFTRQFATMIEAGLPLTQGLDILSQQAENKKLKSVVSGIKARVESGNSLAASIGEYKNIFSELYINMIKAGEASGNLDVMLKRLANLLEKNLSLKRKIRGALIYPIVVLVVATIVTSVLLVKVVPTFADMYSSMGKSLPLLTQIVINLSNFLKQNMGYIIGALILFIIFIKLIRKTERGRYILDDFMLKLPIFGELIKKSSIARFSRTLGTMLASGVPILDGLDNIAKTSSNAVIEKALYFVREQIGQGNTMGNSLKETKIFPPMVSQMVTIGEETGRIDFMLEKIADFYEEEVDQMVANLTTLIEPFVIVFLGVVIGGIIIAMYLPIFKIGELI